MNREKKYPKGEYVVSSTLMVCRREDAKIIFNGTGNIMMPGDLSTDFNETAALAALISAAPELVEALEFIRERISDESCSAYILDTVEQIDAALAKAYGKVTP